MAHMCISMTSYLTLLYLYKISQRDEVKNSDGQRGDLRSNLIAVESLYNPFTLLRYKG